MEKGQVQTRVIALIGLAVVVIVALFFLLRGTLAGFGGALSAPTDTAVPTSTASPTPTDTPLPAATDTPVPTSTATFTPTATNTPPPQVVIAHDTLCFSGPGANYTVIGALIAGTEVEVVAEGIGGGWYIINHPVLAGLTCWVAESDLSISGELVGLPTWEAPPPPENTATPQTSGGGDDDDGGGGGGGAVPCWTATPDSGGNPSSLEPHPVCP